MSSTQSQQLLALLVSVLLMFACTVVYLKRPPARPYATLWLSVALHHIILYAFAFFLLADRIPSQVVVIWSVAVRMHVLFVGIFTVLNEAHENR